MHTGLIQSLPHSSGVRSSKAANLVLVTRVAVSIVLVARVVVTIVLVAIVKASSILTTLVKVAIVGIGIIEVSVVYIALVERACVANSALAENSEFAFLQVLFSTCKLLELWLPA